MCPPIGRPIDDVGFFSFFFFCLTTLIFVYRTTRIRQDYIMYIGIAVPGMTDEEGKQMSYCKGFKMGSIDTMTSIPFSHDPMIVPGTQSPDKARNPLGIGLLAVSTRLPRTHSLFNEQNRHAYQMHWYCIWTYNRRKYFTIIKIFTIINSYNICPLNKDII